MVRGEALWQRFLASASLRRGRGPALVIAVRHVRELLHESCDLPQFVVGNTGLAKARHASHPDAVPDHPEYRGSVARLGDLAEIGSFGVESLRELRPLGARR